MNVWRDEDDDFWVFSADGDAAWLLDSDPEEWSETMRTRQSVEDQHGPLVEVAPDDGDLIGMPPVPAGAK